MNNDPIRCIGHGGECKNNGQFEGLCYFCKTRKGSKVSKIDSFKNGAQPERRYRDWSSSRVSLVAADMTVSGGIAQYHYADGRVCSHPDGAFHDCGYVEARNRLIPTAERMAYEETHRPGEYHAGDSSAACYSRAFMGVMNKLWEGRHRS